MRDFGSLAIWELPISCVLYQHHTCMSVFVSVCVCWAAPQWNIPYGRACLHFFSTLVSVPDKTVQSVLIISPHRLFVAGLKHQFLFPLVVSRGFSVAKWWAEALVSGALALMLSLFCFDQKEKCDTAFDQSGISVSFLSFGLLPYEYKHVGSLRGGGLHPNTHKYSLLLRWQPLPLWGFGNMMLGRGYCTRERHRGSEG